MVVLLGVYCLLVSVAIGWLSSLTTVGVSETLVTMETVEPSKDADWEVVVGTDVVDSLAVVVAMVTGGVNKRGDSTDIRVLPGDEEGGGVAL